MKTCKHIRVVWLVYPPNDDPSPGGPAADGPPSKATVTIRAPDLTHCKFCGSAKTTKKGFKYLKRRGPTQQYKCLDCRRHFINNLGFERRHAFPEQVTLAVGLVFSGLSTRKAANTLAIHGLNISHMTIHDWAARDARSVEGFVDRLTLQVGDKWRTDEVYVNIRGDRHYLLAVLDSQTRYWLARMIGEHKATGDVRHLFAEARDRAGKIPS